MNTFSPGDYIIQRHQAGAQPRLVLSTTDDHDVVTVWDNDTNTYRRVLAWAHDLFAPATDNTRAQAVDHTLSENYARTTSHQNW